MDIDPVTELQRCLALVRPVGMSDAMAKDWLAASVAEVRYIDLRTLARACSEVRRTATHHGQIVPMIIKEAESKPDFAVTFSQEWDRSVQALQGNQGAIEGRGVKRIGTVLKQIGKD